MLKKIPNILSIVRIFLIPIILKFIFDDNYILALIMLTVSGLTDVVDGYIARHFDAITDFRKTNRSSCR
ncbi:MAG: CDP-alcohol phosphatidyltransferase family protein [Lachnospiraceae bacterium]|jgi:cardiolipin synthase|nr:CDP-alcohol phosphatidyltransferase family protein [Lachnospiraceae bacterium]